MRNARVLGWLTLLAAGAWVAPRVSAGDPCERITPGGPGDCDANGFADECDLGPHALGYAARRIYKEPPGFSMVDLILALDFEPDGDQDLLFFREKGTLSFTNRGGGVFDPPQTLPITLRRFDLPASASAVDFDGDGVPDVVTADREARAPGEVSVLRGDGSGGFSLYQSFRFPDAYYLAAGDLDGDRRPELIVGSDPEQNLRVYSFDKGSPVLRQVITPPPIALEAQLADLDRDGDLDLFLRHHFTYSGGRQSNGLVSVWVNDGSGMFTEGPLIEHPDLGSPRGLALADLDGDGWLDVVCVGEGVSIGGILVVARNDRRSGFLAPVELARAIPTLESVTAADFDGDGDPDLLVSSVNFISPLNGGEALLFENLTRRGEAPVLEFVREGFSRDKITSLRRAVAVDVDGKGGVEFVAHAQDAGCGYGDALLLLSPLREPRSADCDGNGIPDPCDIASGREPDADRNGIPDRCEPVPFIERCAASSVALLDCNRNGIDDACDALDPTLDAVRDGIPDLCQTTESAFGITGPGVLQAAPGEEVVAEYRSLVFPGKELTGLEPGIQGWAVSIRAYNCEVIWATTADTDGGAFCQGGPRRYGFEQTGVVRKEGVSGAVSAVVLSIMEPVTLPMVRPGLMLRLGICVVGPPEGGTVTATLVHEDGLYTVSTPVHNVITRRGASVYPRLFGRSITVTSIPVAFRRADANADGLVDISDGIHTLSKLFLGGARSECRDAADFDDSGSVDITDPIATFQMLFLGGRLPPAPGRFDCGVDPTGDPLSCLGYGACN